MASSGHCGTHTPCIRRDEQNLLCAVYRLSPRCLARIQLARLGPCLGVGGAVLQEHGHGGDGIGGPAQRLEHGNPPLPDAHVGGVVAEYLLIRLEHFLQLGV